MITGEIKHYYEEEFKLIYDAFDMLKSTETTSIEIDSTGYFTYAMDMSTPFLGKLDFGKIMLESRGVYRYVHLYVEPGDSIFVNVDLDDIEGTLAFSGTGVDNNVLVNENVFTFDTYPQRVENNYAFIAKREAAEYLEIQDSLLTTRMGFLDSMSNQLDISDHLYETFKYEYYNDGIIRKMNYPSGHTSFNKGKAPVLPDNFYDFVETVEIEPELENKGLPYLRYVHFFLTNKYELEKEKGSDLAYIDFLKNELSGKDLYVYMAYSLKSNFDEKIYRSFDESCPFPDVVDVVKEKYSKFEKMLPGSPAPEVMLTTAEGEQKPLSSFIGQNVYIDFWATWCKPCIAEFPSLAELEKEYHDKNLTFLSVSVEAEKDKWKTYLEKNDMEGNLVWVDPDNKKIFNETFNIRMIPRFVLIDDEGKIVDSNAPRPSSGSEIKTLFDQTLAN
ncbi:hypothetical protein GCM10025777_54280 [Membranihabitans marinus]